MITIIKNIFMILIAVVGLIKVRYAIFFNMGQENKVAFMEQGKKYILAIFGDANRKNIGFFKDDSSCKSKGISTSAVAFILIMLRCKYYHNV